MYYKGCCIIKTLVHYILFSQKKAFFIFFTQLVFGIFSKKNLWWILFIAKLQPENCRVITLMKETLSWKLPWEFSKLLQSIIFRNFSICGEEANYMKDYMKARRKAMEKGWFLRFMHWVLLNIKHLLESTQSSTLNMLDLKGTLSMKYLTHI